MIQRAKEWTTNTWTVIAPRNCPYNSPAIGASKPMPEDPENIRMCLDGRSLNEDIEDQPDSSLPGIREIIDRLGSNAKWFTTLDLAFSGNFCYNNILTCNQYI